MDRADNITERKSPLKNKLLKLVIAVIAAGATGSCGAAPASMMLYYYADRTDTLFERLQARRNDFRTCLHAALEDDDIMTRDEFDHCSRSHDF